MSLSFFEKGIINNVRNARAIRNTDMYFLIGFLGINAIRELIDDTNFKDFVNYIREDVKLLMIRDFAEDSSRFNLKYDKSYYISFLISSCKLNTLKKMVDNYPKEIVSVIFSENMLFNNLIKQTDEEFIKKFLDAYIQEFPSSTYIAKVYSLVSKLNDTDKSYYLKKIGFCDDSIIHVFDSFDDRKLLIDSIKQVLSSSNWLNYTYCLNYLEIDDFESIANSFDIVKTSKIPHIFVNFSTKKIMELIDKWILESKGDLKIIDFINAWILNKIVAHDYGIFNIVADIIKKHNLDSSPIQVNYSLDSFLYSISTDELLNFYKNCKLDVVKKYILGKTDLWVNEIFLNYLFNNEPDVVYDFLIDKNKFDSLNEGDISLFFKTENIKVLLNDSSLDIFSLYYFHSDKINPLFEDKEYCFEILNKYMYLLPNILKVNPDIEIFRYAIEIGYYPDKNIYDFCLEKPEFYDLWYDAFCNADPKDERFADLFRRFVQIDDEKILDILLKKSAESLDIDFDKFLIRFNALKSVNRDILSTFDYRLFDDKFSFLSMNKIEMLSAHKDVTCALCKLSVQELYVVKKIMNYSSDSTWVDLLDRVLNNISSYHKLVLDLYEKNLSIDLLDKIVMIFLQKNVFEINTYDELCNYDSLVDKQIDKYIAENSLVGYKKAISLSLLGINYDEFLRIYNVYCFDFENFKKVSKNSDLIKILGLVKNVCECTSLDDLKRIYDKTPRVFYSSTFLVNLDSEIRNEFTRLYNETLYKVSEKDKFVSCNFKEIVDENGNVSFVRSDDGTSVSFYDPSCLFNSDDTLNPFSLMMTSLGAYSYFGEPDDYYANWNVDLIESHGFCCSYLSEENLGTARISHVCLGFTDFDLGSLLLSAPYDIGSSEYNKEFNTSRKIDTLFCTPKGMINNTRHTHNEVVWERRNLKPADSFKKEPSYVIFFCEDFNNFSAEEKKIYDNSVKAAIQLGKEKPLPVLVIDRSKIAQKNREKLDRILNNIMSKYIVGDIEKALCLFFNSKVGFTYCPNVMNNYFNDDYQNSMLDFIQMRILDLYSQGNYTLAGVMYKDYCNAVAKETSKKHKEVSLFYLLNSKFKKFKSKMDLLITLSNESSILYSNLIFSLENMNSMDCSKRWSQSNIVELGSFHTKEKFMDEFLNTPYMSIFHKKISELQEQNIYLPNTPYDNRHITNMFLYAILMLNGESVENVELVLDVIKYQSCSYMDGIDKMNIDASLLKAEKLMLEAGYDKKRIDSVKLLMLLKDNRNLSNGFIYEVCKKYDLEVDLDCILCEKIVEIVHDVNCLEHTRFVTSNELNSSYFFNEDNFRFARIAYELQEAYAIGDINKYLAENPGKVFAIRESLKTRIPQEVIRNIRKGKIVDCERDRISFEDAFLEIDVPEKLDPLGLVDEKMKQYGDLPKQISILEFFKTISQSTNYEYLIQKIYSRDDLYSNVSKINGEYHANNVSLFSLYLSNRLNLNDIDTKTLIEASMYIDIGRVSDSNSVNHSTLSALKYGANVSCPNEISSDEVKLLIEAHALKDLSGLTSLFRRYKIHSEECGRLLRMINILRDAVVLDKTRFNLLSSNVDFDTNCLCYYESKEIIEACQKLNYIVYQDFIIEQQKQQEMNF